MFIPSNNGNRGFVDRLPNGTLQRFINRALDKDKVLPNRMLWRLFMCMIRMVIALAWPDVHQSNENRLEEVMVTTSEAVLRNTDINPGNLMFGNFLRALNEEPFDEEHSLTPIMKMIDLGRVVRDNTPDQSKWNQSTGSMIDSIGYEMRNLLYIGRPDVELREDGTLDQDLVSLVSLCIDWSSESNIDLSALTNNVRTNLTERDAAW
ncbi:hypothetical protein SUNI508_11956 [Seiridium unicorne]|uniref:Protein kinase domain-containing protein n=1 Tax=Seiridium unicorne TaxID=138068 RepID=A0ABR2UEX1_9PEZI